MIPTRREAKAHARATMRGIWAAVLSPFTAEGAFDEHGFRANLAHYADDLGIDGVFVGGKQGEFFAMSVAERKRLFEVAVDEIGDRMGTIMSCSDQNMDTVIELASHAQAIGARAIVVHAPVLHFLKAQDETLSAYYRAIAGAVDIPIALWSHPDSGYLMSPDLCLRLAAENDTVVAIKYSVPRAMYAELTRRAGDGLIVSTASEEEWLENVVELGWRLYLCSNPPFLFQSAGDTRMRHYTDMAFAGDVDGARAVSQSLEPVRHAFKASRPAEKPHAHAKAWMDLLGQTGGHVRRPMLGLDAAERAAVERAFEASGLNRGLSARAA